MTGPIYTVGDIHGQIDALETALALIEADGGADLPVVFLGDLVDRGPDSRGVIERLRTGQSEGRDWIVLLGNHDRLFLDFLAQGKETNDRILSGLGWLHPRLGGVETLASYGVNADASGDMQSLAQAARHAVPQDVRGWLEARPRWHEFGHLLFVHAGIRPGVALDRQDPDDLIWIRDPFLDYPDPHPWLVVHGHTAIDHPRHYGNRVNLDGGAGFGRPLHPAVFEDRRCWLLSPDGRVPLDP